MGLTAETLTFKQAEFARLFFLYRCAAKAARMAGYSWHGRSATVIGSRLLKHQGVRDAIHMARYEAEQRRQVAMIQDLHRARTSGNVSASLKQLEVFGRAVGAI